MFLSFVHECESIKEKHNKDKHQGERWGKEHGVNLGQKWMKNRSKNSV